MTTSVHIPFSDPPERKSIVAVAAPWLIAAAVIILGAYLFARLTEAPPVAEGKITKLFAVEQRGAERVIVGIEVHLKNVYDKEIIVRGINAKLVTPDGQELTDQPAGAGEHERYFKAIPQLKQSEAPPLSFDTKIAPGQQTTGLLMVSYPVTQQRFEQRKSFELKIDFYGMKPIVLRP